MNKTLLQYKREIEEKVKTLKLLIKSCGVNSKSYIYKAQLKLLEEQLKMIDDIIKMVKFQAQKESSTMECYSFLYKAIGE